MIQKAVHPSVLRAAGQRLARQPSPTNVRAPLDSVLSQAGTGSTAEFTAKEDVLGNQCLGPNPDEAGCSSLEQGGW